MLGPKFRVKMIWQKIQHHFVQIKNIIKLLLISYKHRKDYLIFDTYSFDQAKKIGEFTFRPALLFSISAFLGIIISIITVAILHFSPLGYSLLKHQTHPLENEFKQVAQRLQTVTDSLNTYNAEFEKIKMAIASSEKNAFAISDEFIQLQNQYNSAEIDPNMYIYHEDSIAAYRNQLVQNYFHIYHDPSDSIASSNQNSFTTISAYVQFKTGLSWYPLNTSNFLLP